MKAAPATAPAYAPLFPYLAARQNAGLLAEGELVIDNFAGIGGASTGMEAALGRPVDHAINHDPVAVSLHRVNHPHSHHSIEDVWQVDPREVTKGQPVALCWFSPDCKDFSKAKGGTPVRKHIRGLAWVAVRWAAIARPRIIILENVEEFQQWGPLRKEAGPNGKVEYFPDMTRRGRTFNSFVNALRYQGYEVEWRELRASDYGTPTIRKRLFLIARRDGLPIIWPAPTHAAPTDPRVQAGQLQPFATAASCIDWTLPTPSIFDRKRPLVRNTLNRVAQGLRRFVLESDRSFIVTCNHGGDGFRGQPLDQPFNTITAAHEAHGLVTAHVTKFRNASPGQSVTQPLDTVLAGGEHFGIVASHLVQHNGGTLPPADASYPVGRPARTVLAQGGPQALVSGALVACGGRGAQARPKAIDETMHTITSKADMCLAAAHLTAYYSSNGAGDVGQAVTEPARTIPTVDRFGPVVTTLAPALTAEQLTRAQQVAAFLTEYLGDAALPYLRGGLIVLQVRGEWYVLADIGMRMLTPRELARCQGFPESYELERTAEGKPLSKARQVRGIGNSVCPQMAEILTRAQLDAVLEQAAD